MGTNGKSKREDFAIQVKGLVSAFGSQVVLDHLDMDVKKVKSWGLLAGREPESRFF